MASDVACDDGDDRMEARLDAYVDGELDAPAARAVERHLHECAACRGRDARHRALRAALQQHAPRFAAPHQLRDRVRAAARDAAASRAAPSATGRALTTTGRGWRRLAIAASLLLVLGGATGTAWHLGWRRGEASALARQQADDLVDGHVRSLLAGHLVAVASGDPHAVRPWFTGKLDFSPPVVDLAARGFPLLGGRVDYVGGGPVAALVYRRRRHVITVFVSPLARVAAEASAATRHGYHVLGWSHGDLRYWAVSDLNRGELGEFARQLRKEAPRPGDEARP